MNEARIRESFARQAFMGTIGASLGRIAPGEVEVVLPVQGALLQQNGFVLFGCLLQFGHAGLHLFNRHGFP